MDADPHDFEAGNLLIAVCEAIEAAGDAITDADKGAVALAKAYAAQIDESVMNGSAQDITKALYLGPHLLKALETLGLTPSARAVKTPPASKESGKPEKASGIGKFRVVG